MSKTVLHIHLSAPSFLNKGIGKAFRANGFTEIEIDWQKYKAILGIKRLRELIIARANRFKPDLIFIQVQSKGVLDVQTVQELLKVSPTVMFDIDARSTENSQWMYELAPHITHYFFSNKNDVEQCKALGIANCSVLQSSCDPDEYFNVGNFKECGIRNDGSKVMCAIKVPDVVFIGTNTAKYPLSNQRKEMVAALKAEFGENFKAFGLGFSDGYINPERERELYSNCKIAIMHNHFSYPEYNSDRKWRALFCGAEAVDCTHFIDMTNLVWFIKWRLMRRQIGLYNLFEAEEETAQYRIANTYSARVKKIEKVLSDNYGLTF